MLRRPLLAVGVVLVVGLVAAAVSYAAGVGPFAPATAARSVVFVAISRSTDEADAREIEAIDLAVGTRELFDAGGRITALAVAPDRRTLYVALEGAQLVFLDAATGNRFAAVDLGSAPATALVVSSDGARVYAVTTGVAANTLLAVDAVARRIADRTSLPAGTPGAPVIRPSGLLVPIATPLRLQLVTVTLSPFGGTAITTVRGAFGQPVALAVLATSTAVVAFDTGGADGGGTRIYVFDDPTARRETTLRIPFGFAGRISVGPQAAVGSDGSIHVCATSPATAPRYRVSPEDLAAAIAGNDCGLLAGGDQLLLAKRDPPQLLVLDPVTGRTQRTLPLAGVPARLVR